jgi:hypothetical protein
VEGGEIAGLLAAQLPRGAGLSLPLSGGWDSRLLAGLASRHAPDGLTAWTVSADDGTERDLRLAGPVADGLGIAHRLVIPGSAAWLAEWHPARGRLQCQTWLHTWMAPLARVLRRRGLPVLDGLAGDVLLFGSSLAGGAIQQEADPRARRRAFLAGLVGGRLADAGILAPAAARWLTDTVRESYLTATDHLDGYPDVITASQLLTRTTRAIAACPTWLLGPEVPVEVPFLHPDVLTAALRIPAKRKEGGRFYRELLEQVCGPRVASLPSTRDPLRPVVPVVRRQTGAAALAALAGPVSSDPVMRPLVGPRLAAGLADPAELHRLVGRSGAALAFLQWADLLVYWRRRHSDRLVWPEGGWPS